MKYIIVSYIGTSPSFLRGFCVKTGAPEWGDKDEAMLYNEIWEVGAAINRTGYPKAFAIQVEVKNDWCVRRILEETKNCTTVT